MITMPNDYEQTVPFGQSDFKPLEKGGYICQIIKAEELSDKNGNPMIHIAFDICEGENKGYFMDLFQSRKERQKKSDGNEFKEVKYPFEGQSWIQVLDYEDRSKTSRKFKGFCTAVEDSGTKVWNDNKSLNLEALKSAKVGIVFQRVEDEYDGKKRWKTVPWGFRKIESIASGDFFVPDDKPLKKKADDGIPVGFAEVSDDVPF